MYLVATQDNFGPFRGQTCVAGICHLSIKWLTRTQDAFNAVHIYVTIAW